jgi:small GTP-binding protein
MSNEPLTTADEESPPIIKDENYHRAMASVELTLQKLRSCPPEERERLRRDLSHLEDMLRKLEAGRVEIVVFGEISTGKSALINALIGREVSAVDVQGGWTKEVWQFGWETAGYHVPGLESSELVLIDTPGLNEVGGQRRGELAQEVARRADLLLFVTDSDLNDTEYSALTLLAGIQKPMLVVLNKIDLYSPAQRERLLEVLREERLRGLMAPEDVIPTAADPREIEYVIQSPDGRTRSEWRRPEPDVGLLKARILEILDRDGLALMALNAAMYAADKSDRIATLRVQLREKRANQTIWSFASVKAVAVGLNIVPGADALGGIAVDATMVATLAHIYGLRMSWMHARKLVATIAKAAGWVLVAEFGTHLLSMTFKALTLGYGTVITAVPQGAAAGYGSYIVGQAARYYFEHGSSWGSEGPKLVVQRLLEQTDKQSVIERLKEEIKKKIQFNPHAESSSGT